MTERARHLRPVEDLGLYFRPDSNGHVALNDLLIEGRPGASGARSQHAISGAILAATAHDVQEDLRQELRRNRLEAVLDTQALELAYQPYFERPRMRRLKWAGSKIHNPQDLRGAGGRELADAVAKHVIEGGYSAVLSPSHFITGPEDPWFDVDLLQVSRLRRRLNSNGGDQIPIYYLLAIHSKCLGDEEARHALITGLAGLADSDVDALFLRIHPFGQDARPAPMRRYIDACRDFHQLALPIVADRTGAAGITLMAFGAIGGIVSGMALGEKFDANRLARQPRAGSTPNMSPRVYIESLGIYLSLSQAREFFSQKNQTQSKFGCRDQNCCRKGVQDMLQDPRRHLFYTRMREVRWLSKVPKEHRPSVYMDEFLRPATDKVVRAAQVDGSLMKERTRLERLRESLGKLESLGVSSFSRVPRGRRRRRTGHLQAVPR